MRISVRCVYLNMISYVYDKYIECKLVKDENVHLRFLKISEQV